MIFVLLANHAADICPLANATTRDLILKTAPQIPSLAQSAGVELVAGPFVNREHTVVMVVQSDTAENVDRFLSDSHLVQWNSISVLPSLTMEEGLSQIQAATTIF
ncbi:hypothetical protein [Streptomyces violascens]|uniref:Muconolactone isomerase domain-containing protein n=1 Tax=Streptomyces violascens TaxID=67381 RepID=A0ABQ3QRT7_9ACTN|nr:hypothetical protein [Streptomyces violascens]GGT84807.1 hypothetical protein GCM10010289_00420 [Streptomyces violascens]GHI40000.1 hypothetical protein Sviol_44080 [Streptomyces violascens]